MTPCFSQTIFESVGKMYLAQLVYLDVATVFFVHLWRADASDLPDLVNRRQEEFAEINAALAEDSGASACASPGPGGRSPEKSKRKVIADSVTV